MMGEGTYVVGLFGGFALLGTWSEFLVPLILLRFPSKTPIAVLRRRWPKVNIAPFGGVFTKLIPTLYGKPARHQSDRHHLLSV